MIELSLARGRVALRLTAERMGADLAVTLSGGDRPHVGAVAVSQPRADAGATTSVVAIPGHREDELARKLAARLAAATRGVVCVACGIHVERIAPEEIEDVQRMSEELADELLERLASPSRSAGGPAASVPKSARRRSAAGFSGAPDHRPSTATAATTPATISGTTSAATTTPTPASVRPAQRASSSHHPRSQAPKRRKPRRSTV